MFFKRAAGCKATGDMPNFNKYYSIRNYPEAMSFIALLNKKINEEEFRKDSSQLIKFLSPPLAMVKNGQGDGYTKISLEHTIDFMIADYPQNMPDVIFIPGNNDLSQLDDLVHCLILLKKKLKNNSIEFVDEKIAAIPIVISGKGGHGVTAGPIFATTEAQAMHQHLKNSLFCNDKQFENTFYLENSAVNSIENVDFTKSIMRHIALENQKERQRQGLNVWLVPTPVGGIRQLLTVIKQSGETTVKGGKGYNLQQVYMLPNHDKIMQTYFNLNHQEDVGINLFAALRETMNYLNYMLYSDLISPNAPDLNTMRDALSITFKYYKCLTQQTIKNEDSLIATIIKFAKLKEEKGGVKFLEETDKEAINASKDDIKPIIQYFLKAFAQIERQHMAYLPEILPHHSVEKPAPSFLRQQERLTKQYSAFFHAYPFIEEQLNTESIRSKSIVNSW